MYLPTLSFFLAASRLVSALPSFSAEEDSSHLMPRAKFPFNKLVAFGDNLSDNGNGSYAHGVQASNPMNPIYGYRTWTNGPVAVSYLSTFLGVPLTEDYAFGSAYGGSKIGATINNSYTTSMYAQDAFQQVQNYTKSKGFSQANAAKTLHFIWIGNNDISLKHISTRTSANPKFAREMAAQMNTLVGRLVAKGAKNIFVSSLYPRNLSASRKYLASNAAQIENLALAIQQANDAIRLNLLAAYPRNVIWYDAFQRMTNIYNNAADFGIKYVLPHFCDGYSQADWNRCVTQGHGEEFYWMQQTDMTTRVHYLVAQDMAGVIQRHFA